MYLGDNLLRDGIVELVERFRGSEPDALILLTPVADPEHYGVAELDGDRVVRLVEKPKDPPERPRAGRRLHVQPGDLRGRQVDRAVGARRARDHRRDPAPDRRRRSGSSATSVSGWWKDTGQLEDMLEANRLVLEDLERRIDGELIDSKVEGRVVIEDGRPARARPGPRPGDHRRRRRHHRLLHRPVHGDRPRRRRSSAPRSSTRSCSPAPAISDLGARMEASLLGRERHARRAATELPKTLRMMVGDNAEIHDPMRVLVTGAGGMLGQDVVAAARGPRARGRRPRSRRPRHHRRPRGRRGRRPSTDPDAVVNCAAWTDVDGAEEHEAEAMELNDDGRRPRRRRRRGASAPRSSTSPPTTSSTAARASPYVESDGTAPLSAYGRSKLAGETSVAIANPKQHRRPHLVALRHRRQELRRDDAAASATSSRRCSSSPTRSAARPTPGTSPRALALLAEPEEYGVHHIAAAGQAARGSSSRRRSSTRPGSETRVMAATTEMIGAPGAAARVLGPRQRAPRPRSPAGLARRPQRVHARPRASSRGGGMRLLVTGGAGFIGSAYVRRRLEADPQGTVLVLDKLTYAGRRENLRRRRTAASWSSPTSPTATLFARRSRAATRSSTSPPSRTSTARSNRPASSSTPTSSAPSCCSRPPATPASRYVQVSTDEVYGSIEEGSFTEASPLEPSSPYSASKAGGDLRRRRLRTTPTAPRR